MCNPLSLLAAVLVSSLASANLQALVMEINFTGEITNVTYHQGDYWEPDDIIGAPLQGRMWFDTDHVRGGRLEYHGIWWTDMDYGATALWSSFTVGDRQFDSVRALPEEPFNSEEFIQAQARTFIDGEQASASLVLRDNRREAGESISLWLNLFDPVQDFVPYTVEDEFDWSAFELPFHLPGSSGEFRYSLDVESDESYTTFFSSRSRFVLHDVFVRQIDEAEPVPEPSATIFVLLGLLGLMLYPRRSFNIRDLSEADRILRAAKRLRL